MKPRKLPPSLAIKPFTNRNAAAAGVTRNRLRALDLEASVHGVRSARAARTLADRCALFAARLAPGAVVSHSSAALLHGAPLPWKLEADERIHFLVNSPARAPHAAGLRGHSMILRPGERQEKLGVLCTTPARTWRDLASMLSLPDLVAVGDHFLHWRLPLTSIEELVHFTEHSPSRRGLANARAALPLLNDRAESRPESRLRVIIVLSDLPHPLINHVIVMTEDGREVRPDFEFREYKLILEYQGDYHRTKEQWRKDMTRRSRLESAGWIVMEINADDLLDPAELVARISAALRRQGWQS